ncbi:MAG: hypothetical protein ACPLUL_14035 [Thermanaerothrix sp.]|uniref:hypothetical protein n=1 Tax=Thermanaerothrix sp. TaxID=2972675 RepID=UPI003C7A48C0
MKYSNQVILDGQVSLKRVYRLEGAIALELTITTDLAALGGVHRVVVTQEQLVLEALAFVLVATAHDEALQATIYGWLFSTSHVVAEAITFHVRPQLREQAVSVLRVLEMTYRTQGDLPEIVAVNGWRVRVSEVLDAAA